MSVYTELEKYTVLLHAFDTLDGACEYMNQIIAKGECKVLPLIKGWVGSKVVAQWQAKDTLEEIKYEQIDLDDFSNNLSDKVINTICKLEDKYERIDEDVIFLARLNDGYYYTTGSSAYVIENNFKTELQQKSGSSAYVTRFPVSMIDAVLERMIASGYKICFV